MLKLSLHQFLGLSITVDQLVVDHGFQFEHLKDVQLFIGDPTPNGDITIDIKCPKVFMHPKTS